MGGQELEAERELLTRRSCRRTATVHIHRQSAGGAVEQRQSDDGRRPAQQLVEDRILRAFRAFVQRTSHPQHRSLEPLAETLPHPGDRPDLLKRPFPVKSERPRAAEELRGVGDDQNGFHTHAESPDLTATLA
ncbi:hypothetical protein RKD44_004805 [Streptomyces collinus]